MKLLPLFISFALLMTGCSTDNRSSDADQLDQTLNPIDSMNALIKADPGNADLYFERAKVHYEARDLASSMSDVGRALKLDSSNAEYYMLLANLKLINKQSRDSRDALLKAYAIEPNNIDVLLKLGELYMVVEDFESSFKYLNEALQIDIHNATAYRLKGFNYKYAGDTTKAVSSFMTAIEQDPDDYDSYLQLGLLFSVPLDPLALDYYDNAIRVRPQSLEARYAKALHLQRASEDRQALALYDEIIELNAAYFNAFYNKGFIYLEHLSKYDSAAIAFTQAIEHGPEGYVQAIYNRGLARERSGELALAAEDYKRALELDPQYDLAAKGLERVE